MFDGLWNEPLRRPANVREYATPAGFRAAVEATLREKARRRGVPAYIIRRQAALERLIVRLTQMVRLEASVRQRHPAQGIVCGGAYSCQPLCLCLRATAGTT